MEDFIYLFIYFLGVVLSVILIIRFFDLCRNVVAIKKEMSQMNINCASSIKNRDYLNDQYLMYKAFGDYSKAVDVAQQVIWLDYQEIRSQEYSPSAKNKQLDEMRRNWEPFLEKQGLAFPDLGKF